MSSSVGKRHRTMALVVASVLLWALIPTTLVHATLESCSVTVSPQTVQSGTDNSLNFDVTDTGSSPILWLKFIAPNGGYFIPESASATGWNASVTATDITMTGGNLPNPFDQGFVVGAFANTSNPNVSWTVQASDDAGGNNPTTCSGNISMNISDPPISQSNIRLSNLTDTSVTVLWDTNVPGNSQINYGMSID